MKDQREEPAEGQKAAGASGRILRLALAEMAGPLGDIPANLALACELAERAVVEGAQLVLFPEGCLTGNALKSPEQQAFLEPDPRVFGPLSAIARKARITVCVGFVTRYGGGFNVAHAILDPEGGFRVQRKCFRAESEPSFLKAWPDPERVVFEVAGIRLAIVICSEMGAPAVKKALSDARPDLLLHPSAGSLAKERLAWPEEGKSEAVASFSEECRGVVEKAAQQARLTGMPKAGANPLGFDGETWWPGNSYAVDARGEVVLWLPGENRPERMKQPRLAVGNLPV